MAISGESRLVEGGAVTCHCDIHYSATQVTAVVLVHAGDLASSTNRCAGRQSSKFQGKMHTCSGGLWPQGT